MNKEDVKYLIVHCAYTPETMDIGASDIDRWHREKGWMMIGYHKVIKRDGTIEDGRPLSKSGAHVRGMNRQSIGIVLIGGMNRSKDGPEINYTDEQMASLRTLLDELKEEYPTAKVRGHTDFDKGKTCPNFNAGVWYEKDQIISTM